LKSKFSGVVHTYSKPLSTSRFASSAVFATFETYSSSWNPMSWVYINVLLMFLCPRICMTWRMSFVLWYSIVPLKCLIVWKWICINLGLCSFLARFLARANR